MGTCAAAFFAALRREPADALPRAAVETVDGPAVSESLSDSLVDGVAAAGLFIVFHCTRAARADEVPARADAAVCERTDQPQADQQAVRHGAGSASPSTAVASEAARCDRSTMVRLDPDPCLTLPRLPDQHAFQAPPMLS